MGDKMENRHADAGSMMSGHSLSGPTWAMESHPSSISSMYLHVSVSVGVAGGVEPGHHDGHLEAVLVSGQADAQALGPLVQPDVVHVALQPPVLFLDLRSNNTIVYRYKNVDFLSTKF